MSGPVRPLIFLPADLTGSKIGGIQSFVQGFIKFAPPDFELECIGATTDPDAVSPGRWTTVEVEGRGVRYLPVVTTAPGDPRRRIPVALRYTLGLVRHRRRYHTRGRILNFHRAGVPLVHLLDAVPKVQYVHLNVADIYRGGGESRWQLLPGAYHRVEDITIPRMDRVFVVNEEGVAFYRQRHRGLAPLFEFLPTWYDDTIFGTTDEPERQAARSEMLAELRLGDDARVLLFVGRLEAQKDPELLLDAVACARERDSRLRLLIVGSGGLEPRTRRRASELGLDGIVRFLGPRPRPEVARLMVAADALVLASRFEGMPITAIEALASGLPIVAPAVGELPRLVRTGRTGWLVAERTREAIADGILRTLELPLVGTRGECIALASEYRAPVVLGPVYELHRELHASVAGAADPKP